MDYDKTAKAGACRPFPVGTDESTDRLMSLSEVAGCLNVTPVTASRILKRHGVAIELARHVYVKASAFEGLLDDLEGQSCQ